MAAGKFTVDGLESHPGGWGEKYTLSLHAKETGISFCSHGPLARIKT